MPRQRKYQKGSPEHIAFMRFIAAKGHAAALAKDPDHQSKARSAHSSEDLSRWGARGYQRAIERHPNLKSKLFHASRAWRLEHPSKPEAMVWGIVQDLGLSHLEREHLPEPDHFYTVDLGSAATREAIFVDGAIHELEFAAPQRQALWRERALERLQTLGYRILILCPADLTPETVTAKLQAFVQPRQPSSTWSEDEIPF